MFSKRHLNRTREHKSSQGMRAPRSTVGGGAVHNVFSSREERERNDTAPRSFSDTDKVGFDTIVLICEKMLRVFATDTTHSSLNLIPDKKHAVFSAKLSYETVVIRVRYVDSAFALDWLKNKPCDFSPMLFKCFSERGDIIKRYVINKSGSFQTKPFTRLWI